MGRLLSYRERVGGDLHDVAVQLLGHGAELGGVHHVLRSETAARLGDGEHAVADEGGLVRAEEVLGALLDGRDVQLDGLGGRAEARRHADVAGRARRRGMREDDLGQAVGEAVAHVGRDVGASDKRDHRQQGPHVEPDGLGLHLVAQADVELAGKGRVGRVHVVLHARG